MAVTVAHHHGFKCAGSTVVHVLNRNWPDRVLHVEHRVHDQRIRCEQVRPFIDPERHVALTSHLLRMPARGEELAHVHFALVRDPIERLLSTYRFAPEERRRGSLAEFVAADPTLASDFHVRHLGCIETDLEGGWYRDLASVPLGMPHVLIGLVERFADSMFLLERRLAGIGCAFDGSVGDRHNISAGPPPDLSSLDLCALREQNAADYALFDRVGRELDRELAEVDPDGRGRAEHAERCAARASGAELYLGVGPSQWVYLSC